MCWCLLTDCRVRPHAGRHALCANLLDKGVRPQDVQCIMGHKDLQMTLSTYNHPMPQVRGVVDVLPGAQEALTAQPQECRRRE